MDRSGVLAVILLVLIVVEGSDGSVIGNIRKMVGIAPEEKRILTEISPSPGPIYDERSDPSNVNTDKSKEPKVGSKGLNNKTSEGTQNESHLHKEKNQEGIDGNCEASSNKCKYKQMVACLQNPENGSQKLFLRIQNEGESTLNVNISVPASVKIDSKELEIPKQKAKTITVSVNVEESNKIVLNGGNGVCTLYIGVPVSEGNFFQRIPSYATHLTPIYGAYFLFLIALIIGGTWACCKFGKKGRRGDGGVPYQELEMGMPGSSSAGNLETTDVWDQGWDDDWDEERAVKSPGGHQHVGNVSANGLTARSSNRDGWEKDWDD